MSVAFTQRKAPKRPPEVELPDRPISPHANLVTASGLEALAKGRAVVWATPPQTATRKGLRPSPPGLQRCRAASAKFWRLKCGSLSLSDFVCDLVGRLESRPDDEQLFSSGPTLQPSLSVADRPRLAAEMKATELMRVVRAL